MPCGLPLPPALRIVPTHVKWRIARITLSISAALGGALYGLGCTLPQTLRLPVLSLVGLMVLGTVGYAGWCLWPRWRWGIAADLRAALPCPTDQRVCLSFDDGPTPGLTDQILALLRQHGVQATFFVLTHKARRCPDLVRRIAAEGHGLGLHGEDHRVALFRSASDLQASLQRARDELSAIAGQPITLFRPSHGWKNRALLHAVRRVGLRLVFWDYGVWDTDAPPPPVLRKRLYWATPQGPRTDCPPTVLLHDGRDDLLTEPPHAQALLLALAGWLPSLRQRPSSSQQRL